MDFEARAREYHEGMEAEVLGDIPPYPVSPFLEGEFDDWLRRYYEKP